MLSGHVFRAYRRRIGLTQAQLGARIGLNWWTISAFERGTKPIPESVSRTLLAMVPPDKLAAVESSLSADDPICWRCMCWRDQYVPCGCPTWEVSLA